jgi:hypothetical protein
MGDDQDEAVLHYIDAAAQLMRMPLTPERRQAVAIALTRVAAFAAHLEPVALEFAAPTDDGTGAGLPAR